MQKSSARSLHAICEIIRSAYSKMAKVDLFLILLARIIRMFSFGAVASVLFLHLQTIGMTAEEIGFLFSAIVFGDLLMTIPLTTRADRWTRGRKRVLVASASMKIFAGVMFSLSSNRFVILIAGIIGVISPTGGEVGPFMAVEQAALTAQSKVDPAFITKIYSVYNFVGYLAQAAGAFVAGYLVERETSKADGYRLIFDMFTASAVAIVVLYAFLSNQIEVNNNESAEVSSEKSAIALQPIEPSRTIKSKDEPDREEAGSGDAEEGKHFLEKDISTAPAPITIETTAEELSPMLKHALALTGLKHAKSLRIVLIISLLFIMDAFAGGLVMQSVIVGWFHKRYDLAPQTLGALISGMNILAGISALLVIPLSRFGPLNVAVFSHLPSNVMLVAVPLMPNFSSSAGMILARSTLSQMDVPARQAFVAISVAPEERSAAGGITMVVRSLGVILSPLLWGPMMSAERDSLMFAMPFIVAGVMKVVYDLMLYFCFRSLEPRQ